MNREIVVESTLEDASLDSAVAPQARAWWKWLVGLGLLLAVFAASWILTAEYTTEQTVARSFVIDQDFTKVRKIMVRTNAAKEIVTMGGTSEFVEQKWEEGSVATGANTIGEALLNTVLSADPDWELKLNGTLKVRTLDDYVGREVVTLSQDVAINPDSIVSNTNLLEGSPRLLGYAMTTSLAREEDHTRVDLKLTQAIKTDAPWFAHGIANRRVKGSAGHSLEKQEQAMIQLIDENKDKTWLFPLK